MEEASQEERPSKSATQKAEKSSKPRPWEWLIPFGIALFAASQIEGSDAASWFARILTFSLLFSFPILVVRHQLRKGPEQKADKHR